MLIVNADDLGRHRAETDAALACFAQCRISSTSAMVFMEDSERAAELARGAGIDVGLHLNLSESFSARDVPARLLDSHNRVRQFLGASKYALIVFNPLLVREFAHDVDSQYSEFLRLYGHAPSHIDGHQHMHVATNVLLQRLLPKGSRVRRSFSFGPDEKSALNRWYRRRVDGLLATRHVLNDYFFSLSHHLTRESIEKLLPLAACADVELMTHPAWRQEYEFLMSDAYAELLECARAAAIRTLKAA